MTEFDNNEQFLRSLTPQTFRERVEVMQKLGIPIIPLLPKSKIPCTRHAAYDATLNRAVICEWVNALDPASNCAAVARFDGYWMLDDDSGSLADKYREDSGHELPATFTVRTSRGFHYYYLHDERSRATQYDGHDNSGVIEIPGYKGEARCNNQYVVAPGSVHPSGVVYEIYDGAPIVAAPAHLLEWLQKAYALSESLKPESDRPKDSGKTDPGFRKLFDAVGYRPLVNRINSLDDIRLHVSEFRRGETRPCPMPQHRHKDYSNCFGSIKNAPELLKCLGNCQWSGDMVAAVYELDGGRSRYGSMYDAARAICREENLNFNDFFSPKTNQDDQQRDAPPEAGRENSKSSPVEVPQPVEVNHSESELTIIQETLPEFPRFTGSLADMAEALAPDLPYCLKFMSAVTVVGSLLAGKVFIAGSTHVDPRFYTVMIDTKGAGKGGSWNEVRGALSPVTLDSLNIAPSIDSGPALVLELAEHPRTLLYADELDKVFETAKPTGSSRNSLFAELLTLYDGHETGNSAKANFQLPKETRDRVCKNGSASINVTNARFSLLGGVQPDVFATMWRGVKGGANGLQSRFVLVSSGNNSVPEPQRPGDRAVIRQSVDRVVEQVLQCTDTGALKIIGISHDLSEQLRTWWKECSNSHPKASTRTPAMLIRILVVLCVTNDVDEVTPELVAQAIAFGGYQVRLAERFMPSDAMTWSAAFEELILTMFRKHGGAGLTMNQVRRYVNPEKHQLLGGFGPFLQAWNNLKNTGMLLRLRTNARGFGVFGLNE
jgi:Bifunctional DNA primase/polymerase, N-terminal